MNDIFIPADPAGKTPQVTFKLDGELRIEGRSIPENALEFYDPLLKWVTTLQKHLPKAIEMTVRLEYFNSSTSKLVLYLFKTLEKIHNTQGCPVKIIWHYNKLDDDMLDSGKDYQSIIQVPFEFVEY